MENILETKKKFTVDRRTWARGGKNGTPALLNDQGNQCCLGFVCEQSGVPLDRLRCVTIPSLAVRGPGRPWADKITFLTQVIRDGIEDFETPYWVWSAMSINDDAAIEEKRREKLLTDLFSKHSIDIEFIN